MQMTCEPYGIIYVITNKINGKQYVGQTTVSLQKRFIAHICNSKVHGYKLARAIVKYGKDNFEVTEFATCFSKEALDQLEIELIAEWDLIKNGYNLKTGGSHGKHTEESRKAMSRGITKEIREQLSKAKMGSSNPMYKHSIYYSIKKTEKAVTRSDGMKFNSISAAARFMRCSDGAIYQVMKGIRHTLRGYSFKFTNK